MRKTTVVVLLLGLLSTQGYADSISGPPRVEAAQGLYSDEIVIRWDSVSDSFYYVYRAAVLLDGMIYFSRCLSGNPKFVSGQTNLEDLPWM